MSATRKRPPSGAKCNCPARLLDPALVWTYCEVCGGIYMPFDKIDQRIYDDWLNGHVVR